MMKRKILQSYDSIRVFFFFSSLCNLASCLLRLLDVCMVFELCGDNLLTLIRRYNYRGLPLVVVRYIAKHVLEGLRFMHEECQIIHTDLKPENVLISRPNDKVLEAIWSKYFI